MRAQAEQVRGGHLAVDHHYTLCNQVFTQGFKRKFGRVRDPAEHGFTKEYLPQCNTVQAADVIYGITMGRDSASQIISLRLDQVTDDMLKRA